MAAAARIVRERPDARFAIAGARMPTHAGYLRGIEAQIAAAGLRDQMLVLGEARGRGRRAGRARCPAHHLRPVLRGHPDRGAGGDGDRLAGRHDRRRCFRRGRAGWRDGHGGAAARAGRGRGCGAGAAGRPGTPHGDGARRARARDGGVLAGAHRGPPRRRVHGRARVRRTAARRPSSLHRPSRRGARRKGRRRRVAGCGRPAAPAAARGGAGHAAGLPRGAVRAAGRPDRRRLRGVDGRRGIPADHPLGGAVAAVRRAGPPAGSSSRAGCCGSGCRSAGCSARTSCSPSSTRACSRPGRCSCCAAPPAADPCCGGTRGRVGTRIADGRPAPRAAPAGHGARGLHGDAAGTAARADAGRRDPRGAERRGARGRHASRGGRRPGDGLPLRRPACAGEEARPARPGVRRGAPTTRRGPAPRHRRGRAGSAAAAGAGGVRRAARAARPRRARRGAGAAPCAVRAGDRQRLARLRRPLDHAEPRLRRADDPRRRRAAFTRDRGRDARVQRDALPLGLDGGARRRAGRGERVA